MAHVMLHINREDEYGHIEQISFSVPKEWLADILEKDYETTLDEFMDEYTSFESEQILEDAEADCVVFY